MGAATTFGLHESKPRIIGEAEVQLQCLQHTGPQPPPKHHHPRSSFPLSHSHANGKLKLEDPWLDPHKLVGR